MGKKESILLGAAFAGIVAGTTLLKSNSVMAEDDATVTNPDTSGSTVDSKCGDSECGMSTSDDSTEESKAEESSCGE